MLATSATVRNCIVSQFAIRHLAQQATGKDNEIGVNKEGYSAEVEGQKPLYATKASYQRKVQEQRYQSSDAENGHRPTKWQRRFLIWTKLYQNQKDIPEIVANGTMNRMHDRLRVLFIITATLSFFSIFFVTEHWNYRRIQRDRDAGVIVTKM